MTGHRALKRELARNSLALGVDGTASVLDYLFGREKSAEEQEEEASARARSARARAEEASARARSARRAQKRARAAREEAAR